MPLSRIPRQPRREPSPAHVVTLLGGLRPLAPRAAWCALLAMTIALVCAASASAVSWSNEAAMVNSTTGRDTFVADPGQGNYWSRAQLIRRYGVFYRAEGFGNVLAWAPQRRHDPGKTAKWAGCGSSGPQIGLCPENRGPLHQNAVSRALFASTEFEAVVWDRAFIALACGNFSEVTTDEPPPPAITGKKFEDVNANGSRDAGEPGLSGWRIGLYQHGVLLASATTDASGDYRFVLDAQALPIDAETFELREVQQPGWEPSRTPAAVHVAFGSHGQVFAGNDFGNYRPATVTGAKYEDMDADGDRDAGDPGLADWTIEVSQGPSAPRTAQTGAGGSYTLAGLRPGRYTVAEQLQAGWRFSAPADGTHTITVSSGETATADFGNYRPATITGVKFDDHDVDRFRDAGEPGLAGWTIGLSGGRSSDATELTDGDGGYAFHGLIPGSYVVGETMRPGWRQSAPASGTHTVTVRSGDTRTATFGNVCLGTARVAINEEGSGDAVGAVEVRIEEIAVTGVLANEPPLPRTTTGTPTFGDLLPGTYRVIAFLPERVYTSDPDVTVVDGRLAVVKQITVRECDTTAVPIALFSASDGKVTGGMTMQAPSGSSNAGFVFMTRRGEAEGSLEFQDRGADLNLHTKQIEQILVRGNEAWIGGVVEVDGTLHRFSLHLVDNGEPGGADRFELLLDTGYRAGYERTIDGGNVQIHRPAHG